MENSKTAILIAGGTISEEISKEIIKKLETANLTIAIDKGLEFFSKKNIIPHIIVGDFDSIDEKKVQRYNNKAQIYRLNPEKDCTDTHYAMKVAINNKCDKIVIYGATGTRIDHVLGNINILKECSDKDIDAKIVDCNNEISLINKNTVIEKNSSYKYVSFIPLTTKVKGLTLQGFKYDIKNVNFCIGQSIGVSNEQILEKATISIKQGVIIMIKSKD